MCRFDKTIYVNDIQCSVEADNDDTIAALAQRDGASVLSQDNDFLRYRGAKYPLYKDFSVRKGKLVLQRQRGVRKAPVGALLKDSPLTGKSNPFRDAIEEQTYMRGIPSPLVQELGNPHIHVRPLRAALYCHLGTRIVSEEFPDSEDGSNKCVWLKEDVEPDDSCADLLFRPTDAVEKFAQVRPSNVSDTDWYKHQFALGCIIAEICWAASGETLLETLEPLLDPCTQSDKNTKALRTR